MVGLVREAKGVNPMLRAVAALNAADAQGHDNDEAMSVLATLRIPNPCPPR